MKHSKRLKRLAIVGLILTGIIIACNFYLRQHQIQVALEFGHLAELPDDSKDIEVETAGGMFSRSFWLTFESSDAEIDEWLKKSKELKRVERAEFNEEKTIKLKKLDEETGEFVDLEFPRYIRDAGQPEWFNPEEIEGAEYYEVSIPDEALFGKIWIDRKNKKVYVNTSYS